LSAASNMIMIAALLSALLTFAETSEFLCVQGTDSSAKPSPCLHETTACYGPKFTDQIGFASGVDYGCGTCDPTLSFECTDCSESGCNQPPELGESYSCYNYRVSGGVVTRHPSLTTCHRSKDTPITCNMPASTWGYKSSSGCGPCGESAKQMGTCVECYSDSCNHQETSQDRIGVQHLRRARRSVDAALCAEKCPYS